VQTTLNRKPGKWLKEVLESMMDWQMDHPEATKDEAKEWLKSVCYVHLITRNFTPSSLSSCLMHFYEETVFEGVKSFSFTLK